ncbi:hypothetical protein C0995_012988 [Termitomyces sp. Mi166|nr:hypothetical protein C0995_012988 [Termitomyces sp. Mi166\
MLVTTVMISDTIHQILISHTGIDNVTCSKFPGTQGMAVKQQEYMADKYSPAGDVLITLILCILLHHSRTGFHRSDTMINKLILFAVNTGFLTSLCAVASLISIVVAGDTFLYIAFYFCIGRLYSNSLLATLNARKMIRGSGDGIHSTSVSLPELPKKRNIFLKRPTNISVKIDTKKQVAIDSDQGQELHDDDMGGSRLFAAGSKKHPSVSDVALP